LKVAISSTYLDLKVDRCGAKKATPQPYVLPQTNVIWFLFLRFRVVGKMAMDNTFDKTALETIDLLEARLKRIEYAVCGHVDEATLSAKEENAAKRVVELEHSLHQLASKSRVIQDLLKLCECLVLKCRCDCTNDYRP
jgi:hypothetical protein